MIGKLNELKRWQNMFFISFNSTRNDENVTNKNMTIKNDNNTGVIIFFLKSHKNVNLN